MVLKNQGIWEKQLEKKNEKLVSSHGMSSLHQDDMSESGEMPMPETREPRKARPSRVSARVSRVGRKSVHSEFGEATVAGQAEDGWDGPCWKHTRSGPQIHQL